MNLGGHIRTAADSAERERPVVPWDRLILKAPDAATFLKMPESTFRKHASDGEFDRHRVTDGYYVYDLLDWFLSR